ncbi:MAG: glycosyltransferase [Bacteroidales bacterium]|nr:glycosyltransferase [Bacteroidales bacterium]
MIFDWFQLSLIEWIFVALLFVVFLLQLLFYLYYYRGVWRKSNRIRSGKVTYETAQPPVSVIICARNQAFSLEQNLPLILEQDYPEFQVVVVNDASTDDTENVLVRLEQSHFNLYHTFLPTAVQSVSAKKMAMTIGIKAAKYDILLLTEANCIPTSNQWISSMMRHFDAKCDVVLGYSSYKTIKGFLQHLVTYDTLFTALQFMGFAETGRPFMGFGQNLAYRKDLFFKNRGFASHLNLKSGEDDLFVGEIANTTNTSIDVSPESKILASTSDIWDHWKEQKKDRLSTSSFYRAGTKFRTGMEIFSRFLFYVLSTGLLIIGILRLNIPMIVFSCVLFILRYILQLNVLNQSAKCFGEHRFYFSIPLFDVLLPMMNLWFRIGRIFHKDNSYTWRVLR